MDVARVHRILRLILLLQSGPPMDAKALAAELEVSRRTLFRDLTQLQAAGVPYYFDQERGGYRVAESFFLPPVSLTVNETLALLMLSRANESDAGRPLNEPKRSAIGKLLSTVPEEIREVCEGLLEKVSVNPSPSVEGEAEVRHYPRLQLAVEQHRTVDLMYQPPAGRPAEPMRIDPYALHFAARSWYLFGHSHTHGEVRIIKLLRITSLSLTDRNFTRPANFSVRGKLGNAWQLIPGEADHDIELLFDQQVATNVAETRWHPTQQVELMGDGRARVRFTVSGLDEIAWWLCGYADRVEVVKPDTLRDKLRDMHKAAAARLR